MSVFESGANAIGGGWRCWGRKTLEISLTPDELSPDSTMRSHLIYCEEHSLVRNGEGEMENTIFDGVNFDGVDARQIGTITSQ